MSDSSAIPENKGLLSRPNDDRRKILFVTIALSLVCSVLVSTAAVTLRPLQEKNAQHARKLEILKVAGLRFPDGELDTYFSQHVQTKIVNLDNGEYSEKFDMGSFDERKLAREPNTSLELQPNDDIASIKRRTNYARVYLIPNQQGVIDKIVLPVHGYGLWSTMYGFLALNADTTTVAGLSFYEQAETAGLGAEITNPKWLAQFSGKLALNPQGQPLIRVNKGPVDSANPNAAYSVDGISGATLTSNGVTNLMHFWLGQLGFGPYLAKLRKNSR